MGLINFLKNNMISVVYTNSKCNDVYNIFEKQYRKFNQLPLYKISDTEANHVYNQNDPYWKHWVDALEKIEDEYFIYHQEDFILYDNVNDFELERCKNILKNNKEYSFVRLIKSGFKLSTNVVDDYVYEIGKQSFPLYSMQATIWKKQEFIDLYKNTKQEKWFECEEYENACKNLNIQGLYYYSGEKERGGCHCDSSIYPYIATAVVKGKWNLSEYNEELRPLLIKNNININIRGTC